MASLFLNSTGNIKLGVDTPGFFADGRLSGSDDISSTGLVVVNEDESVPVSTYSYSGLLSGSLIFVHSVGDLTITGANSYTGGTSISSGTLRLSQNSSAGTYAVYMSPGATLILDADMQGAGAFANNIQFQVGAGTFTIGNAGHTIQLNGVVSSAVTGGALLLTGGGVTIFNGANSYNQVTQVSAGTTLQIGTGGTTGKLGSGALVDHGALIFDRSNALTVANAITGTGTIEQAGSGTTILTGANTYVGTTTISAGTLQIGSGGATGTLGAGAVVDDGVLIFNRSNALTVANAISGTGTLTQAGPGTTLLTGANTYSGVTTVTTGTLQIGNGGTTGSLGSGPVVDDAVLAFNRSDLLTLSTTISGTGKIVQSGPGTVRLTLANTFSGGTDIAAGTLDLAAAGAAGTGQITFKAGAQTLALEAAAFTAGDFANAIAGFDAQDTIDLVGITASSASLVAGNVLNISTAGGIRTLHLDPAQSYAGKIFQTSSDGAGGTNIKITAAPVAAPVNPWTLNESGGHDISVTAPSALGARDATTGPDLLLYSSLQPLTLPSGIENIVLSGGGGRNVIAGNELDNRFTVTAGDWSIDGLDGNDTVVFARDRASYIITCDEHQITIIGPEGTQTLSHIETLLFADKALSFDRSIDASVVFNLYQTALGRPADPAGVAYWLDWMHDGKTANDLANAFVSSPEYQTTYGIAMDNTSYVAALYQEILHRPADETGLAFWTDRLAHADRGELLVEFASSEESQIYIGAVMGQGVMLEHQFA